MRCLLLVSAFVLGLVPAVLAHEGHFGQIPDFRSAYPEERIVIIPAGQSIVMPSGDIDLLWVEGHCIAPREGDMALKVREIVVTPTGYLDMGVQADPVRGNVTTTFADGDFIADDPNQWGHGLLVFGKFTCYGLKRKSWVEGTLVASDWLDGDRIRLPDTRPGGPSYQNHYRRDVDYFVSGGGLGALTFPREGNGVVGPIAANMTSNISFRSENPAGTRGHTIFTDHADISIDGLSVEGLGRTKPERLSASNLIGRYPIHFHHLRGPQTTEPFNATIRNVVVDGLDYRSKWGIVVHGTSWIRVEDCVATRTGGAGFVTEDGSETNNLFLNCLAFDCNSKARDFPFDVHEGFIGSGFWFKSMAQHIIGCVSLNNRHGFQCAINRLDAGAEKPAAIRTQAYQTSPGGPMDGEISAFQTTLTATNNRFVCNNETGYDAWGSSCDIWNKPSPVFVSMNALPICWEDCQFAYNGSSQVQHSFTQSTSLFSNCEMLGANGSRYGNQSLVSYDRVLYFDTCLFDGVKVGAMTGRGAIFNDCIFNTPTAIQFDGESAQNWPYGVTLSGNVFAGEPFLFTKTDLTLADIKPHEVTLSDVYARIEEYRAGFGTLLDDEEESEPSEVTALKEQIAAITQQIADLHTQLNELQSKLIALEVGKP